MSSKALLLLSLLLPQQAEPQVNATNGVSPASFNVEFTHAGPLIRSMTTGVRITAVDSSGNSLEGFQGSVEVDGETPTAGQT